MSSWILSDCDNGKTSHLFCYDFNNVIEEKKLWGGKIFSMVIGLNVIMLLYNNKHNPNQMLFHFSVTGKY